ncbi:MULTISPECIES: phospho-sugar mutase [unclassified Mycobacteroides]|uniref:phospho-sugar mutase n=1 Tax=unclassified Mycobacteroides TaxID=2618759 RepID=UPI001326A1C0|nr:MULTISPECIES: phospho-sugar mutase [unclassified Mycobacteroides]MUM19021.1 phosphomannomutase [Mycobacteroides sp. CBMA 326]
MPNRQKSAKPGDSELLSRVRRWIADDPDLDDRAELGELLAAAQSGSKSAIADLSARFSGPLDFGTAGLRGLLGAGEHRMNRAVVQRAAAGLGAWLSDRLVRPRVVIGFDARNRSEVFATDSASVLVAAGCEVFMLPRPLPTPVLAFCVRAFHADCGIMVTASHNPAQDNGYKVYLGGRATDEQGRGAQIVPPVDAEIAAEIRAVDSLQTLPLASGGWTVLGPEVIDAYLAAIKGAIPTFTGEEPRIVVTALHGVGGYVLERALRANGFGDVHQVSEQYEPDPGFPTVAFPNPEEPGALDRAVALANIVRADLVIAVDPDADRCCIAIPGLTGYRALSGDDLGRLLGEELARQGGVLACSVVSSRALSKVAARHKARFVCALTGFKWIARVPELTFGYEEALGYCVAPDVVRDKDGISAALVTAGIVRRELSSGRTLWNLLDDLDVVDGVHRTAPVTIRTDDVSQVSAIMERLRAYPPTSFGGSPVVRTTDLERGVDGLPPANVLQFDTTDVSRVVFRPSGTEAKLKCYCEVVVVADGNLREAQRMAEARLLAVVRDVHEMTGHIGVAKR